MNAADYVKDILKKYDKVIPYDDFSDIATTLSHNFNMSVKEASDFVNALRGPLEIGSQEYSTHGIGKDRQWEGQAASHNFGKTNPGALAEPKASFNPLSKIELTADFKVNDVVKVEKNDQAPWGAAYTGVIENIKSKDLYDIRDIQTGELLLDQPKRLLKNPLATGREDVRVQQKRNGDPSMWGVSDVGDPNSKREYPGLFFRPRGTEQMDVKNPLSVYDLNKRASDQLYSIFLSKLVKEYGKKMAKDVMAYLEGKIENPSLELKAVLRLYDMERLT